MNYIYKYTNKMDNINTIFYNLKDLLIDRNDDITNFLTQIDTTTYKDFLSTDLNKLTFYTNNTCIIFLLNNEVKKLLINDIKIKNDSTKIDDFEKKPNLIYTKYKEFIENHNNIVNYIIIFNNLTSSDKKIINSFDKAIQHLKGGLSIFLDNDLYFNPTKHHLVDKHRKLNQTEIIDIMTKYNVTIKSKFPAILKTDPISRWLGLKSGDIVEIDRYNPNCGLYKYYRACI